TVPYEFLRAGLSMNYSLDRELGTTLENRNLTGLQPQFATTRKGPLVGDIRFVPSDGLAVTYKAYFDTDEALFSSQSIQGTVHTERYFLDGTYSVDRNETAITRRQTRGQGSVALSGGRVSLGGVVSYDILCKMLYQLGS